MKTLSRHFPNLLTLGNVISGCIGLHYAAQGQLREAAYALAAGLVFDFLDGAAARLLRAESAIGKPLDSLADMVSFGALPAMLWYVQMAGHTPVRQPWWAHMAWLIAAAAALRLAKFTIDQNQQEHFSGVPTPAVALLVASSAWWQAPDWVWQPWVAGSLAIALAALMLLNRPFLSFKFKTLRPSHEANPWRYGLLLGSLMLLAGGGLAWIPAIFVLYLTLSVIALKR
jgi:CDP-diacylglycerol--serine O-phosphatidyltransferase